MPVWTMPPLSCTNHSARPMTVSRPATTMAMLSPLPPNLAAGALGDWAAEVFSVMILLSPYTR